MGVRLWTGDAGYLLPRHQRDMDAEEFVRAIALDAPNRRLGTASEDGIVRMWDIKVRRATRRFAQGACRTRRKPGIRRGVQAVAFDVCEQPTRLASGEADGTVRVWDVRQAPAVLGFSAHTTRVSSLALLGGRLLSASIDGRATYWDLRKPVSALQRAFLGGGAFIL